MTVLSGLPYLDGIAAPPGLPNLKIRSNLSGCSSAVEVEASDTIRKIDDFRLHARTIIPRN